MTGNDLRAARRTLGEMWGFGRPLFMSEIARALRLKGRDPGATVKEWEDKDEGKGALSGPASVALELMLGGALPPDGLDAVKAGR